MKDRYFYWLAGLVDDDTVKRRRRTTFRFLADLHRIDFYWLDSVPMDKNRADDGLALRESFEQQGGIITEDTLSRPCSMLEMLVALAISMEEILYLPVMGNQTHVWFWELVSNLRLIVYFDDNRKNTTYSFANEVLIKNMLNRNYHPSGMGGLFPLKTEPYRDQREVEIWYQFHRYLQETHPY